MANLGDARTDRRGAAGRLTQRVTSIRTFQALGQASFRSLWLGMMASYLAMQFNILARGYLAYDLTGSAGALGLVSLARGLPQLVLSPFGGVVADRVDKRVLLIVTQVALAALAIVTALLVGTGLIEIWHLVVLGLIEGIVFAFNMPARQAIVPEIVPDDRLINAIALNNAGLNFTRIVGPALAGLLITVPMFGISGVFYLVALSYGGFVTSLMRLPRERNRQRKPTGSVLGQMVSGFAYTWRVRALFVLMAMAFIPITLGMPYQTLLPAFQEDVFHVGPGALGLLYAASGLGALAGSLAVASLPSTARKDLIQIGSGIVFGLALTLFAFTTSFVLGLAAVALVGGAGNAYTAINSTMIMSTAERAYHGRVMSIYMMTWSLNPLSSYPIGVLVDAFGEQVTVGACGLIVALFVLVLSPARLKATRPAPAAP